MRRTLGKYVDCLRTESGWIALDPARVQVRVEPPEPGQWGEVEFLEGLDIRDPEFEHWLRDRRMSFFEGSNRRATCAVSDKDGSKHPLSGKPAPEEPFPFVELPTAEDSTHYARRSDDAESVMSYFVVDLLLQYLLGQPLLDLVNSGPNQMASRRGLKRVERHEGARLTREALYRLLTLYDADFDRPQDLKPEDIVNAADEEEHLKSRQGPIARKLTFVNPF